MRPGINWIYWRWGWSTKDVSSWCGYSFDGYCVLYGLWSAHLCLCLPALNLGSLLLCSLLFYKFYSVLPFSDLIFSVQTVLLCYVCSGCCVVCVLYVNICFAFEYCSIIRRLHCSVCSAVTVPYALLWYVCSALVCLLLSLVLLKVLWSHLYCSLCNVSFGKEWSWALSTISCMVCRITFLCFG